MDASWPSRSPAIGTSYASGPYRTVNNVWNKGGLNNGSDFTQSVTYDPATFPAGVTLQWSWPGFNEEIWAYPEVITGYKPWDPDDGTLALTTRVDAVSELDAHFDLAISGDTGKFNVALEFWLTDKPGGGPKSITTEVMVWLHNGDLTPAGKKTGRYEERRLRRLDLRREGDDRPSGDSEVRWKYVALKADADLLSGSIDLRAVLVALRKHGVIDGGDFIGGFELGAEVAGGAGSLRIDALGHDFVGLRHHPGKDRLTGTDADDLIDGRGGADTISGPAAPTNSTAAAAATASRVARTSDRLEGGPGRDSFVFDAALDGGPMSIASPT